MNRTSYRLSTSIFRAGLFFILFSYAGVNALQAAENTSDIFGYRWTDNKYPEPTIVANWMDATETGNLIEFDEDESQTVALGFDFNFYGNIYSTITISSNGYLTFGSIGNIATNSSIPNPSEPNNIIAPFWDDLTYDWLYYDYQEVYYKTIGSEPNRKFVVEWYDSVVSNNSDSNITFEVILEEQTNDIIFQYMDMSTECLHNPAYYKGRSATIGIENSDGSIGTQYSYNQDSISDNVAIRLSTVAVEPLQEEIIVVPFLMESSDSISVTVLPEDVSPGARITGIDYDITPKPDWFWYQWDIGMYHWAYPGDFLESIYPDASYNGLAFSGIIYDFNGEDPFGTWELDLGHDWNTYMSSASLLIHYAYPENPTFPDDLGFGYEKQGEFCDPGLVGNPVSVYNGNKYEFHTDLNFPTPHGNKLTFSRFYNSRSNELGILGFGWTNSYSVSLQTNVQIDGSSYLKITDYSGKGVYFVAEDATNWRGTFHEKSAVRYDDTFYIWKKIDGSRYGFTDQGRLAWIDDAIGNRQVMTYDGSERLQSVIDHASGRVLTFNYNINNLLSTISGPITTSVPGGIRMTLGYDLNNNLTTVTYADGSGYVYEYNDPNDIHNLTAKKNILNHLISSWSYDDSDRALTSTTRDGKGVTIDYTDPNSVLVTDVYGIARTYAVSLHGAKKKVDDIVGSGGCTSCRGDEPIRYEYDENLNVIEIEYANTRIDQYENFDDQGNPGTVIRAFGTPEQKTISFTYHPKVNQPLSRTEASILAGNKETIWDYDDLNNGGDNPAIPNENPTQRVWKIIERGFTRDNSIIIPYEDVTTFSYNAKGQMTLMDGPLAGDQDETLFDYDPVTGDLLSVTRPLVGTTTFSSHDWAGNPGSITDINNQTTSYTYDGRNRVTDISQNGRTTEINFTLAGDIETITDPEQRKLTYSYDTTYGRLVQITDPLNNYLFYNYNAQGNLIENFAFDATDTKQRWQRYDYHPDPAYPDQPSGKLWKTINFDNSETEYQYNAMGSVVSVTDEMNKTTTYEYDPLNRLSKTIQPGTDTPETIYAYDSHGNLIQVTDAETHTTTYLYDDRGNLLETDSPDTGITTYEYDSIGRLSSKTDAKGITIKYSYDSLNRLTQIDYPTDPDVTFAFDQDSNGMGRLSSMADSITSYAYKYDAFGNTIQETATIGGQTYSTGYGYDLADNLVSLTHQSGRRITYQRGADGRITDVVTQRNGQDYYLVQNISYLPFGPQQSLTFGNALNLTKGFNQGYGITSIITGAIENLSYTPNLDTSIASITNNLDPTRDQDFGYDDLNSLETADGLYGNILFDYDLTGNRQTMTNGAESDTYAYLPNTNMLDTITGTHPAAFSYDANGNIEAKGDLTFVYNENNRIKEAYDTGALAGEYLYNGLNQRVRKIADTTTTIYIYDIFGNLIQEIPDNGSPTQDYVYLNGERLARIEYINRNQCESDFDWTGAVDGTNLATMVSEFGSTACYSTPCQSDIDNNGEVNDLDLIAFANAYGQTNCPLEPENVYYFHNDHRGAPLKMTDENGVIVRQADYTPFGYPEVVPGSTVVNNFRLPGQYYNKETGLHYNWHRYYDPASGRYMTPDPIGLAGGINVYSYVQNDPINGIDPWGLYDLIDASRASRAGYSPSKALREWNYSRNQYNENIDFETASKKNSGWDDSVSPYYHQLGEGNKGNTKFVSSDGHSENIFDKNFIPVTDPVNGPTYNFSDPRIDQIGHFFNDMVPYFLFGTSPDDPTWIWNRIPGIWLGTTDEFYEAACDEGEK